MRRLSGPKQAIPASVTVAERQTGRPSGTGSDDDEVDGGVAALLRHHLGVVGDLSDHHVDREAGARMKPGATGVAHRSGQRPGWRLPWRVHDAGSDEQDPHQSNDAVETGLRAWPATAGPPIGDR
ncbi:MAG: hypothetical protein R2710_16195 [Acidimicrobiales bacterium]